MTIAQMNRSRLSISIRFLRFRSSTATALAVLRSVACSLDSKASRRDSSSLRLFSSSCMFTWGIFPNPVFSISATTEEMTPPKGYFLIARLHGDAVGCGALKCHSDYGEIKRMWVAASTRGLGIGRRILLRLEEIARERNLPIVRLETNKALTEAQALYRNRGYREVAPFNRESYAHHWFEKTL